LTGFGGMGGFERKKRRHITKPLGPYIKCVIIYGRVMNKLYGWYMKVAMLFFKTDFFQRGMFFRKSAGSAGQEIEKERTGGKTKQAPEYYKTR